MGEEFFNYLLLNMISKNKNFDHKLESIFQFSIWKARNSKIIDMTSWFYILESR